MEDIDRLLKKVKKLLALATSDNENEAKVAAEKAQELMVRHNLDMQSLNSPTLSYDEVEADRMSRLSRHHNLIAQILQDHFFVKVIFTLRPMKYNEDGSLQKRRIIRIVGTPANVAVAKYIYDYLIIVFGRLWKQYKATGSFSERHRYSYLRGLTRGILAKLDEVKARVQNEAGLVLVEDPGLMEIIKDMGSLKSAKLNTNSHIESAGYQDGLKVQIAQAIETDSSNQNLAVEYQKSAEIKKGA